MPHQDASPPPLWVRYVVHICAATIIFWIYACEKTDLSPVLGTYTGRAELRTWGFEEITDNNGNFAGVREIRDTLVGLQDKLMIKEADGDALFTVSGEGNLARVNNFSKHEFTFGGQSEFSVVDISDGVENKRMEFSIDESGNISLYYTDNRDNDDRPPVGHEIVFMGSRE